MAGIRVHLDRDVVLTGALHIGVGQLDRALLAAEGIALTNDDENGHLSHALGGLAEQAQSISQTEQAQSVGVEGPRVGVEVVPHSGITAQPLVASSAGNGEVLVEVAGFHVAGLAIGGTAEYNALVVAGVGVDQNLGHE